MNYKVGNSDKLCKREKLYKVQLLSTNGSQKESILAREDTLYNSFISTNLAIAEREIIDVTKKDLKEILVKRAVDYISIRQRSKREIEQYYRRIIAQKYRKYYSPHFWELIDIKQIKTDCLNELTRLELLDDTLFARSFVAYRTNLKPRGKRMIFYELMSKGIDKDTATKIIEESEINEEEMIKKILENKFRTDAIKGNPYAKENQKIIRYLMQKGFEYNKIEKFIKNEK